jgi:hypothetical protein
MRGAFVVQIHKSAPTNELAGLVEEVDSGKQVRFHSETELVGFLRECLGRGVASQEEEEETHEPNDGPR